MVRSGSKVTPHPWGDPDYRAIRAFASTNPDVAAIAWSCSRGQQSVLGERSPSVELRAL